MPSSKYNHNVNSVTKRFFMALNIFILFTLIPSSCKPEPPTQLSEPLPVSTTSPTPPSAANPIATSITTLITTASIDSPTPSIPASGKAVIMGIDSEGGIEFNDSPGYDYLQVNINVNAGEAGIYLIYSDLFTSDGQFISGGNLRKGAGIVHAANIISTELKKGVNSVPIYFNGSSIRAMEADGPYKLYIAILDSSNEELDKSELVTDSYKFKHFE